MLDKRFRLNLDGRPNPKCVVQGDKYRFTVLTSQMLRMEYDENGEFEDRPTQVVWNRNFDCPEFTVRDQEHCLEIDTEYFHLVYDKKDPPYWAFEKGVYVEKFDSLFQVEASIKADTAYYYDKKKLWKLISNVHIQSQKGELFDTELLYWDQNAKKVYSDKAVRVEQTDRIIYAEGFESNEQMTKYTFFKVNNTIFYVDEESTATVPADSVQNDSV